MTETAPVTAAGCGAAIAEGQRGGAACDRHRFVEIELKVTVLPALRSPFEETRPATRWSA